MLNKFHVAGSEETLYEFLKSSISSCDEVIAHYDFVINDISSEISNPVLEARKEPSIEFLKAMRSLWQNFQDDLKREFAAFEGTFSEDDQKK